MPPLLALTREVSPAFARCELTHLPRAPIDVERARAEHAAYERALEALGCTVRRLPAPHGFPDAVFIEDTALVFPEVAVIAHPGAPSRRGETAGVEEALAPLRPLRRIEPPGTLDGGDVLHAGRRVFVGRSARTNDAAIRELDVILGPHGYDVRPVPVRGCLHLKSAVTAVADDILLMNRAWVDAALFPGFERIDVDPSEPHAANALRVGEALVYPAEFPRTRERLAAGRFDVRSVAVAEIAKAEGAVTCCSLIVGPPAPATPAPVRPPRG